MFPHLCASSPVQNGLLRFASGAAPGDLLAASVAAQPFHPCTCTCVQALVRLESRIKCGTAPQHVTRQMPYRLSYTSARAGPKCL